MKIILCHLGIDTYSIVQSQKVVTAYWESKQLVPFGFSDHWDKSGFCYTRPLHPIMNMAGSTNPCAAEVLLFFIHSKLELLTQFQASNK